MKNVSGAAHFFAAVGLVFRSSRCLKFIGHHSQYDKSCTICSLVFHAIIRLFTTSYGSSDHSFSGCERSMRPGLDSRYYAGRHEGHIIYMYTAKLLTPSPNASENVSSRTRKCKKSGSCLFFILLLKLTLIFRGENVQIGFFSLSYTYFWSSCLHHV